jgi:hypothetical protein
MGIVVVEMGTGRSRVEGQGMNRQGSRREREGHVENARSHVENARSQVENVRGYDGKSQSGESEKA